MQLFTNENEAWKIRTLISMEVIWLEMLKLVSFSMRGGGGHRPARCDIAEMM
jgi:hypothetical protein